jgi:hypothetical protein
MANRVQILSLNRSPHALASASSRGGHGATRSPPTPMVFDTAKSPPAVPVLLTCSPNETRTTLHRTSTYAPTWTQTPDRPGPPHRRPLYRRRGDDSDDHGRRSRCCDLRLVMTTRYRRRSHCTVVRGARPLLLNPICKACILTSKGRLQPRTDDASLLGTRLTPDQARTRPQCRRRRHGRPADCRQPFSGSRTP